MNMLWKTKKSSPSSQKILRLKQALQTADAVIIGAGAGLSASAGFVYDGKRFQTYFSDFEAKYEFHDMYSGGFYPYATLEEYWAYWSRYIYINRYVDAPKPVYNDLYRLIRKKDYFILTTNVDHCFQKAGFSKKRLFYTQGDYGLFQCRRPCCQETFDNKEIIEKMTARQQGMKIPSDLIPVCPRCGRPMIMNLRSDDTFAEDDGWQKACSRYSAFIRRHTGMKLLFLELGVGYNTPGIIKYPFWQMTAENPKAHYVCINNTDIFCPKEIEHQALCIRQDIGEVLSSLRTLPSDI